MARYRAKATGIHPQTNGRLREGTEFEAVFNGAPPHWAIPLDAPDDPAPHTEGEAAPAAEPAASEPAPAPEPVARKRK